MAENSSEQASPLSADDQDLFVKDSEVEGRGLFAKRDFPADTPIFSLVGQFIEHDYGPEFTELGPNWIGVGYKRWLIPDTSSREIYLNHCCEPNVLINDRQQAVSIKPIAKGEELLLDYSSTELDPYWELECSCEHPNCRKVIRSFQFLPYATQVHYRKYVADIYWDMAELEREA